MSQNECTPPVVTMLYPDGTTGKFQATSVTISRTVCNCAGDHRQILGDDKFLTISFREEDWEEFCRQHREK